MTAGLSTVGEIEGLVLWKIDSSELSIWRVVVGVASDSTVQAKTEVEGSQPFANFDVCRTKFPWGGRLDKHSALIEFTA